MAASSNPPNMAELLDSLKELEIAVEDAGPTNQCYIAGAESGEKVGSQPQTLLDLVNPFGDRHGELPPVPTPPSKNASKNEVDEYKEACYSRILYFPDCWKCLKFKPLWICRSCKKCYHHACTIYASHYPKPEFKSEGVMVNGEMVMKQYLAECVECKVAKKTAIKRALPFSQEILTKCFLHLSKGAVKVFQSYFNGIMKKYPEAQGSATPELIYNTIRLHPDSILTIEALFAAYRLVVYQLSRKFGRIEGEGEPTQVAHSLKNYVLEEIKSLQACSECYLAGYSETNHGQALTQSAYFQAMEKPCEVPHPVIWVKILDYSRTIFWPAKLYELSSSGQILFHCFDEKAIRIVNMKNKEERDKHVFYTYSVENINRKTKGKVPPPKLIHAIKACSAYIMNLREKLGGDIQVTIPEKPVLFDDNITFEKIFAEMFPNTNMQILFTPSAKQ